MSANFEKCYHGICVTKYLKTPDSNARQCPVLCLQKLVIRDVRSRPCYLCGKGRD